MASEDKLISELKILKSTFNTTLDKIEKDIKRNDKIMQRSDKRQQKEYDALQDKLEEVKVLNKEIEDNQREAVFQMGVIGETRSKETANHVKRVAEYSYILAKAYGLDEKEADILRQASPLHDIGKVGIADAILNKPGRFNEDEREIMNAHAKKGYDMFINLRGPIYQAAAHVSHEHHEKFDGTGYPRGLKGEEIHIYGRITAVADVFDALGSDRVYKKAWDDEKIFKLFKEESGKQFDPNLIRLFFEYLDDFTQIRDSFKDVFTQEA
ncbi:HD domain-containing protein [Sulfurimonas sp. MAG313]|nr:HD domain-containing phosphohydrolase [Sulfurimonas sp. MAG313]MDF1881786.1 HD domain-containing protein [Sulfurimonas sp. MAG313]